MKSSSSRLPIASFTIAPLAPELAAMKHDTFNRVADEWAQISIDLDDALEAKSAAVTAAQRAVVEAAKTGKPSAVDPAAVAAEHDAIVATLRAKRDSLTIAVDEAGNEVAAAVPQCRDEWVAALEHHRDEAIARFERAIADARAALKDFAPMSRAVKWVQDFDHGRATVGDAFQFVGGGASVRDTSFVRGIHSEPQDAFKLLDLIATATAPAEDSSPRAHRTAARSSMR